MGVIKAGKKNWTIAFPAFPGTFTVGNTLAELLRHAPDALVSVVQAMEEDGLRIPPDATDNPKAFNIDRCEYNDPQIVLIPVEASCKSIRINVTMDEGLVTRLHSLADRLLSSRSALLARGAKLLLATAEAPEYATGSRCACRDRSANYARS